MRKAESRIAVFYPWKGLPALDRGSARRVIPLVRLLAERYDEVRILSPGLPSNRWKCQNVEYLFQQPSAIERVWLSAGFAIFDGALHHLLRGRVSPRERRQLWHYLYADFQRSLAREARRVIRWASVVLLEYPFWGKAVLPSCARYRKKSLLTMHDTLSDLVVGNAWLRGQVRSRELSAARKASSVFCVSQSDSERFAAEGITARFVPHGVELEWQRGNSMSESAALQQVMAARNAGRTVCLFVGSSLQANQEAVEAIHRMAAALAAERNFLFAIAGSCLPKGNHEHNVVGFGSVEETLLAQLYQAADIVLAPLRSGTGTSLKVLEAFVHQKALVATQIAVRGYAVQDGRECIICDEFQCYPQILASLRADAGRLCALGKAALSFVRQYDHRVVYRPYLECIDRFLE